MPTLQFLYHGAGDVAFPCKADADCRALQLGDVQCHNGFCVCKSWQPRQRHEVTTFRDNLYLVGGMTSVSVEACGHFSCGEGHNVFLNDVWRSWDGKHWEPLTLAARWPGRADFGLTTHVLVDNVASPPTRTSVAMYVAAGLTGSTSKHVDNTVLNDVWMSTDGVSWTQHPANVTWTGRSGVRMLFANGDLVLVDGMIVLPPPPLPIPLTESSMTEAAAAVSPTATDTASKPTGGTGGSGRVGTGALGELLNGVYMEAVTEVWTLNLDVPGSKWLLDYGDSTEQRLYVSADTALNLVAEATREKIPVAVLASVGIRVLADLADLSSAVASALQSSVPNICRFRLLAQDLNRKCSPRQWTYDGQFAIPGSAGIIEGTAAASAYLYGSASTGAALSDAEVTLARLNPCDVQYTSAKPRTTSTYPPLALDVVCKWRPSPRRYAAGGVLGGEVYIAGGYNSSSVLYVDMWRRDAVLPQAAITRFPVPYSHDTIFEYGCDKAACMFEYRMLKADGVSEQRTWALGLSPVNFIDWCPSGDYTFQVRCERWASRECAK